MGERATKDKKPLHDSTIERCFSSVYCLLTSQASETVGNVARAMIKVQAPDQQTTLVKADADTGGSKNLASSHLLQNVRKAEDYGGKSIYMVTIQGDSPAYTHQGELHFSDEKGNPIIILLCYVQEKPIPGHEDFVLISNNTLVDMNADINFHARASKEVGVLPLRRTVDEPFHYNDEEGTTAKSEVAAFLAKEHRDTSCRNRPTPKNGCRCEPITFPNLTEVGIYHLTGRRKRASRKGRTNPKKDKAEAQSFPIPLLHVRDRTSRPPGQNKSIG